MLPLTTITDGEVVTCSRPSTSKRDSPTLLAISPSASQQGDTFTLQVLGRFTNWASRLRLHTAAFNQDITVNSVTVIDSENLR